MTDDDRLPFFELIDTTYDLIGKTAAAKVIGAKAKAMMFEDLDRFPLALIKEALRAHRSDPAVGHFTPSPAHITAQIEKRRTVMWLSADEAWARTPKLEGQPGLMTEISAQALAVAAPLLAQGEENAARMAFRACYTRLVDRAKLDRVGPKYFVSPGGSYEEQLAVEMEGIRMGMISSPPTPSPQEMLASSKRTPGAKPDLKALLLTMSTKAMPAPEGEDYDQP